MARRKSYNELMQDYAKNFSSQEELNSQIYLYLSSKMKGKMPRKDLNGLLAKLKAFSSLNHSSLALARELFEKGAYDITGAKSKSYFHELLNHFLPQSKSKLAMLIFDIDNFKALNDNVDHSYGDVALCKIAKRSELALKETLVDNEKLFFARYGGEEFCAIILNYKKNESDLYHRAEHLRNTIARLYLPEGKSKIPDQFCCRTITIAGKIYEESDKDMVSLRDQIDRALVSAKRENRRNTTNIIQTKIFLRMQNKITDIVPRMMLKFNHK